MFWRLHCCPGFCWQRAPLYKGEHGPSQVNGNTNQMLTKEAIEDLQGITAALKMNLERSEDGQGTVVFIGREGIGEKSVCRSLREAVASVASQVPYIDRYITDYDWYE